MILICGIPTEPPAARAIQAAEELGIGHAVLDQRLHAATELTLSADPRTGIAGRLRTPDASLELAGLRGVYVRLMDERFLPDLKGLAADAPERLRVRAFHDLLHGWLNIAPIRVASRPRAMLSNMSKTYQANIIRRFGFDIPETLVTNDPAEVLAFVSRCESEGDGVIYKSVSGTRSIVQTFGAEDRQRLARIQWCPTQFQRKVSGLDIRVHVVGQRTFATRIKSAATDYRYAQRQAGSDAELSVTQIPPHVSTACVELATALDLPFAGIDLRRTPAGAHVCFEVNPCPAYSYYESRTGAPIARSLVSWLAGYAVG
jgi:RimK-like ATP-grasp domain